MKKYESSATPARITTATLETLLDLWERTDAAPFSLDLATVRGWLMDELERRNPDGFNAWLEQDTPEDKDLRAYMVPTKKRFRDAAGRLTMTIDQVVHATRAEAEAYYQDGGRYTYQGRAYTLRRYTDLDAHGDAVAMAQFTSEDGYNLFTDPARLGTFLPDVSSHGLEITRL